MGDEEDGKVHALVKIQDEVYDLRLYRHVQRACGLVAYYKRGAGGKGPGDANPLFLPTAQLMWVVVHKGRA